ncbi:hypothetical protein [Microvirga alba]|uniref:Uncharacterized protein n=1 Tax=Microvirga alba TaxID=2791025 RepID=A0A931BTB8_9HYPH|nr:hypothetical protein [Microvirga alba]MBF9235603.1 hypothetical protein [Microvirga alba]
MQQLYVLQPPALYMVQIVLDRLADFPPRQKIIYIGILATIAGLKQRGEVVTAARLAEVYGHDYASFTPFIKTLVDIGILTRRAVPNRQHRGRAFELDFTETDLLRELLGLPATPPQRELDR